MRILLVGAEGSLKRSTWTRLRDENPHWHFDHGLPELLGLLEGPALGSMSDYRTELLIATHRAHLKEQREVDVYLNSLLDSLAYTTVRLANMINLDSLPDDEQERWLMTEIVVGYLIRDSLNYDLIFYFPSSPSPEAEKENFYYQLEEFYPQLLDSLDVPYTTLEGDVTENADTIVTMIADVAVAAE